MLRFDVALEALKRQMAPRPQQSRRDAAPEAQAGAILIPFPLRRLPAPDVTQMARPGRRAPG